MGQVRVEAGTGARMNGALGEMTRSAWKRGRKTGFIEGLVLGFLAGIVLFAVQMA